MTAATEPAHLARAPGGCLSCLRDVPIEIDGVALFDCITLPGTSQQLQNCSSFEQVQLLARWLTEERLASAVPAVMQSLRALPHSGLWLLEQLQIGGNARKLLKEPTASSPSNNTSAAASAPENNGSAAMEENHSQGAASHENNQNAAMEVDSDNGQGDFEMAHCDDISLDLTSHRSRGDSLFQFAGAPRSEFELEFPVCSAAGATTPTAAIAASTTTAPASASAATASATAAVSEFEWAAELDEGPAMAALQTGPSSAWSFDSPPSDSGRCVQARFTTLFLRHGPDCGAHVASRTGIKIPNLSPPGDGAGKSVMEAHVRKLVKARLERVFKGVKFKAGPGSRKTVFSCKKCEVFMAHYETRLAPL